MAANSSVRHHFAARILALEIRRIPRITDLVIYDQEGEQNRVRSSSIALVQNSPTSAKGKVKSILKDDRSCRSLSQYIDFSEVI